MLSFQKPFLKFFLLSVNSSNLVVMETEKTRSVSDMVVWKVDFPAKPLFTTLAFVILSLIMTPG